MKQRIQVDIPELEKLQPLIDRHRELIGQLENNIGDIRDLWLEIELRINQPADGETAS